MLFNSIFSTASALFLVTNPIGNSPAILALVKDFDPAQQRRILMRETIFSFCIAIFFQFFGEVFLTLLGVKDYAVGITGGLLLFFVALQMIFSVKTEQKKSVKKDPFLVPISTPLLSGPGLLTTIMLLAKETSDQLFITAAIALAWVGVAFVLLVAPYLQKALGERGMVAFERLMGMILTMISLDIFVKGLKIFINLVKA